MGSVSLFAEGGAAVFLRDDFDTLENWKPLDFPKIKEHSSYEIIRTDDLSVLRAASKASASGLIYQKNFNVFEYPKIKWRWKVDNIYLKGNAEKKNGDDYPLRIYIIFEYNPEKAGFVERAQYGAAKLLYGEYPPQSGLNYIWASRQHDKRIITSPYTGKAKMIPLQYGKSKVGVWIEEEVNVLDDYRAAFGKEPPARASIAIMNDSDNTKEKSVSYVDYIEISR